MDAAPLTLAHTHARNAVLETRKSNPVAASEEHDLAAGEFATAAQNSSDPQALRTLHLLEQHHKRLAQILRFQHENPPSAGVNTPLSPTESGTPKASPSIQDAQQQPPKLSGNTRLPKRETSSIASNLASARGIPSQPRRATPASPTLSSQQAGARMTEGPAKIRTSESRLRGTQLHSPRDRMYRTSSTSKQPWSPPAASPTDVTSQQYVPSDAVEPRRRSRQPDTEEPFQRFYSTFEGLISKLSAPLAFAGLPLGSDASPQAESSRKSAAETKLDRHQATSGRSSQSAEPDISRIFSRAALQAIRDTPGGGSGAGGPTGGPAESFYVVPTTGGTVSYAGILSRAEKEARRNSLEEGDEDFVDARETPGSPELRHSFTGGSKSKSSRANDKLTTNLQNPKTMEELQMENQALRHLSDTLSKRLHMWEVNAQSSSIALQQSLKAMHHQNIPSPEHHPQASSAIASPTAPLSTQPSMIEHDQRVKELEDMIRRGEKDLAKASRENEKLRNVLDRYRDRWEKLKETAKTRRAEGRSSTDTTATAMAGPSAKPLDSPIPSGDGSRPESENENGNVNKDSDSKADTSDT
ncbi:hypothetical protein P170DRAFT_441683 [Aspergillus steynii IBT 23096]|uniref:Uncharacterized protein n=1 Tax=Aspergillus steynii IBT 23096 TaxID=1392250 RepID=A0A2I2FRJ6_9EURO|nr:uncharacterized protein P170DRAFT_441683 [Aspergillus steynii IBT 23096]PLB43229.1 hypothetical protein P170DRAFT_441683 [Aspergillus steynii IBT 23096]